MNWWYVEPVKQDPPGEGRFFQAYTQKDAKKMAREKYPIGKLRVYKARCVSDGVVNVPTDAEVITVK